MPMGEKRRWWLERGDARHWWDWVIRYAPWDGVDDYHPTRREVALWRLVQWKRIRAARLASSAFEALALHAFEIVGRDRDNDLGERDLLDADAAVLDARFREEEMRGRLAEAYEELRHFERSDYNARSCRPAGCIWPCCDSCGEQCGESTARP